MGWNDRLLDEPYGPTEEERQQYDAWCQYQEYLKQLAAQLETQAPAAAPNNAGLSSQTLSPDCYEIAAIDIFGPRERNIPTSQEQASDQSQENTGQPEENSQTR
jgi:hypothetical protein